MKPRLLFSVLLLAGGLTQGVARAAAFDRLLTDQSALTFIVTQMNVPVEGRFKTFDAELQFDPASPELASGSIEIDLTGIDAGSDEANDEVAGPQWLDISRYPKARFTVSSVHPLDAGRYRISGQLTIKGHTKTVTATATLETQDSRGVLDGDLVIRRADFAIGEGAWADFGTVANEIPVHFRLVLGTSRD